MKAAIFRGPGSIVVEERPIPTIRNNGDAVVRIVRSCVCGSDLWFYRGISDLPHGGVGHEFIGVVHETGADVHHIKPGDFVIAPFAYSDGTCPNCQAGFQTACVSVGFFGQGGEDDGGQAEYVRVPMADGTLYPIPRGDYADDVLASLLTLSDVMGTGYHAAVSAQVKAGDTVAVVGDGAVGLCGVLSAKMLGATRIIAMSRHADRQALAREFGATDIVEERGADALARIMELTDGVGVDAVLECVGTHESNETSFAVARAGAIVGRVGVPHGVEIPVEETFFRNVGMRGGPAPVRAYMDTLLPEVLSGRINPGKVFDLEIDLDNIAEGYAAMDERRAIKALIKVSDL
ncbi:MAG: zinc-dependent alcohol dehydrogenase family protein [Thermomicrobiales bacterium]|nr:zinc-dependent alcohol dehydrogenase family protein [Thermomicrobiales bacterium]